MDTDIPEFIKPGTGSKAKSHQICQVSPPARAMAFPADILGAKASLFSTCKAKASRSEVSLREFLEGVRDGRWRQEIEAIRAANLVDQKRAGELKEGLAALKPGGIFRGLRAADLVKHSGILCLDFDGLGDKLAIVRPALEKDPYVLAYFLSPEVVA